MKISIIGPATQIPPVGWGAVESLIWDYSVNLKKEGHDVDIINIANPKEIIKRVITFRLFIADKLKIFNVGYLDLTLKIFNLFIIKKEIIKIKF